jgi:hypothetical protein
MVCYLDLIGFTGIFLGFNRILGYVIWFYLVLIVFFLFLLGVQGILLGFNRI